MPFEIGPVLRFESRVVAGRKAGYALRVVTGLALAFLLVRIFWAFRLNVKQGATPAFTRSFLAEPYTRALGIIHLTIALLFAPAAAADGFSRERVRGMLASVLTTELSPWRIVLETYVARLIPGLTIWLSSIPIILFDLLWCGFDPEFIACLEIVTLASLLLGVAIALGLSLWTRRTAPTLLWTYGLIIVWVLSWAIDTWLFSSRIQPAWLARINPYFLLIDQWNGSSRTDLNDAWFFLCISTAVTLGLLILMFATLRRVVLAEKKVPSRRFRSVRTILDYVHDRIPRWPGPSLDANPVLWREWRRARGSAWGRLFWIVYAVFTLAATVMGIPEFWYRQVGHPDLVAVSGFAAGIGLLAVAVRAGSAWPEKQGDDRNGLDVLLATPLSARTIVLGKWWGAFRAVPWISVLPTLSAVVLAIGAPAQPFTPPGFPPARPFDLSPWERLAAPAVVLSQVLLYGAALVSLALFLATRFTRQARVLFLTVVVYAVVTVMVPTIAEELLLRSDRPLAEGLGAVSPIAGPILTLAPMFNASYSPLRKLLPYELAWLVAASLVAWTLLRWTIGSFDRWMGRSSSGRKGEPTAVNGDQDFALPDSLVPGAQRLDQRGVGRRQLLPAQDTDHPARVVGLDDGNPFDVELGHPSQRGVQRVLGRDRGRGASRQVIGQHQRSPFRAHQGQTKVAQPEDSRQPALGHRPPETGSRSIEPPGGSIR